MEALVALAILLIMLSGLGYLMNSTIQTNRQARRQTAAANLAADMLETLRGTAYGSLAGGTDGPVSEAGDSTGSGLYFSRQWTVARDTPIVGTTSIVVIVTWTDTLGAHNVQLQSVVNQ